MTPTCEPIRRLLPLPRRVVLCGAGLLVSATMGACVLPDPAVSGIEFSWQFDEVNTADTESPEAIRRCAGAFATDVHLEIEDVDDSDRAAAYDFSCDEGFRTEQERYLTLSNIFLDLRPGTYAIHATAMDDPSRRGATGIPLVLDDVHTEVSVIADALELLHFQFRPDAFNLVIDLRGEQTCHSFQARLEYADVETTLVAVDDETETSSYRVNLASDRALLLNDQVHDCAELGGLHSFPVLDRGDYRLVITLDGNRSCQATLRHDGRTGVFPLDLAALGC
ncbi:MAG: hypothetical protein B7733_18235 [Myxococcales bacterium FL481]|nr:MAG: hypothetical protein B7733_18235 [Myxococcales bacterium FL481]